ncbi:MAG TPA: MoxR family ATPase [Ilumatobacteraceae bacterium]|nr:MoxR family ATPase [Ilumatobacteraceae bacterium]
MDTLPPPTMTAPETGFGHAPNDAPNQVSNGAPNGASNGADNGVAELGGRLVATVDSVIAGKHDVAEVAVATLLSGGHLLIEDIPGVGKTLLAQVLARSVGGTFHRIQGTSDLLPGDITGSMVPSGRLDVDSLKFRAGPVFANIVVFDELNRATPRTQTAMLELAEDATVTVDGVAHRLPDPFMIVATQNPIDIAGTYGLGDGSLDRFRAVITPGRAPAAAELEVLTGRRGRTMLEAVEPVAGLDELVAARTAVATVRISDAVGEYVVQLLQATREHPSIRVGASTRGGVAVVALARAFAAMSRRTFLTPDDIVRAAGPALAHRVAGGHVSVEVGRELVADCLAGIAPPTV